MTISRHASQLSEQTAELLRQVEHQSAEVIVFHYKRPVAKLVALTPEEIAAHKDRTPPLLSGGHSYTSSVLPARAVMPRNTETAF